MTADYCCLHSSGLTLSDAAPRLGGARRRAGTSSSESSSCQARCQREYPASSINSTYIVETVLIVIVILIELIVIVIIEALVLESLAREVVNGAGDDLFTGEHQ